MKIAVNGTLMHGFEDSSNMLEAGARLIREARTAPVYQLWSISGRHPGMMRATASSGGAAIEVEIWEVDAEGLVQILDAEPDGLAVGWISMEDGSKVLGILAEPHAVEGMDEITHFGGWRAFAKEHSTSK